MSAVAFDSLEYAHQLEASGLSREQAEVVAKGVTRLFIHNFDYPGNAGLPRCPVHRVRDPLRGENGPALCRLPAGRARRNQRASQHVEAALLDVEYPDRCYLITPGTKLAQLDISAEIFWPESMGELSLVE